MAEMIEGTDIPVTNIETSPRPNTRDPFEISKRIARKKQAEVEAKGIFGLTEKYSSSTEQRQLEQEVTKRWGTSQDYYDWARSQGQSDQEIAQGLTMYRGVFQKHSEELYEDHYFTARTQFGMSQKEAQQYADRNHEWISDKKFNSGMYSFITDEITANIADAIESGDKEAQKQYEDMHRMVSNGGENFTELLGILGRAQQAEEQGVNITATRSPEGAFQFQFVDAFGNVTQNPSLAKIDVGLAKKKYDAFQDYLENQAINSVINNTSSVDFGTVKKQLVAEMLKFAQLQAESAKKSGQKFDYLTFMNELVVGSGKQYKNATEFEDDIINSTTERIIEMNNNVGDQTHAMSAKYSQAVKQGLADNLDRAFGIDINTMTKTEIAKQFFDMALEIDKNKELNIDNPADVKEYLTEKVMNYSQDLITDMTDPERAGYIENKSAQVVEESGYIGRIQRAYIRAQNETQNKLQSLEEQMQIKARYQKTKDGFYLGTSGMDTVSPKITSRLFDSKAMRDKYKVINTSVGEESGNPEGGIIANRPDFVDHSSLIQKHESDTKSMYSNGETIDISFAQNDQELFLKQLQAYEAGYGYSSQRVALRAKLAKDAPKFLKKYPNAVNLNRMYGVLTDDRLVEGKYPAELRIEPMTEAQERYINDTVPTTNIPTEEKDMARLMNRNIKTMSDTTFNKFRIYNDSPRQMERFKADKDKWAEFKKASGQRLILDVSGMEPVPVTFNEYDYLQAGNLPEGSIGETFKTQINAVANRLGYTTGNSLPEDPVQRAEVLARTQRKMISNITSSLRGYKTLLSGISGEALDREVPEQGTLVGDVFYPTNAYQQAVSDKASDIEELILAYTTMYGSARIADFSGNPRDLMNFIPALQAGKEFGSETEE